MRVAIKTAHGYLSFQPDGRLEYRDTPGSWETLTLEIDGLEALLPPGALPPIVPPINAPPPVADVSYVNAVKAQLEIAGVDLSGPCGAFAITERVVWGLRSTGAGLLSKPGGNNCKGYAVDILCYPNGDIVDLLGDAGNDQGGNVPIWIVHEAEVDPARWHHAVQPT